MRGIWIIGRYLFEGSHVIKRKISSFVDIFILIMAIRVGEGGKSLDKGSKPVSLDTR